MNNQTPQVSPPEPKKIKELGYFEQDHLASLVDAAVRARKSADATPESLRAAEAQQALTQYCTKVILRHKGDVTRHAINSTLDWIIEIPEDQLDAKLRQALAEARQKQAQTESPSSNLVEMPSPQAQEA
jgi:hypothetical protein